MKLKFKDYKKGSFRAIIENLDDLWYLTYIIEKSDLLKSRTFRKIKLGGDDDRSKKVIKKPVVLKIRVEKIEFSKYTNVLRVNGTVIQGPEDIPIGSYHTINLEEGTEFSLQKKSFLKYQIEKLEESIKETDQKILIVIHDREDAYFAILKKYGYEVLSQIRVNAPKKADVKNESSNIFPLIKKSIDDYDQKYKFKHVIVASPGFWREYVQKLMTTNKNIVYATCSSVGQNGINEVIKRPEIQTILKEERFSKETEKVENLLTEISKDGKAQYGLQQINNAVKMGAVSELLVTDDLIRKKRMDDTFNQIEYLMRNVEKMQGKIHIISSEHEAGKKLDGLGGVGAILRYNI
jgi:protein pelota